MQRLSRQTRPILSFLASCAPSTIIPSRTYISASSSTILRLSHQLNGQTVFIRTFAGKTPDVLKLTFPALSPTMTTGNLVAWKKKIGDQVDAGSALADIETDKAVLSFDSQEEGFLAAQFVADGTQEIKIGQLVGWLVNDKADLPAAIEAAKEEAKKLKQDASASPSPPPAKSDSSSPAKSDASSPSPSKSTSSSSSFTPTSLGLSPAVTHLVSTHNLDPASIQPTGRRGRLLKGDVLAAIEAGTAKSSTKQQQATPSKSTSAKSTGATPTKSTSGAPSQQQSLGRGLRTHTDITTDEKRKKHASDVKKSKSSIPHHYTKAEVRVDNVLSLSKQTEKKDSKTTLNDWIVRAAALTLKQFPEVNRVWDSTTEEPRQLSNVDLSVLVHLPNGTVTVPLQQADRKGPLAISKYVTDESAKGGSAPTGALTIDNLGGLGISQFQAIILPQQTCLLAVGAPTKQFILSPFNEDDDTTSSTRSPHPFDVTNVQRGTFITVTFSCDERIIDTALSAQFLEKFKEYVQNPEKML